ncbi:MAG TPA: hypothetical protein VE546_04290, partial [Streptomyces sp.]|uniref:hypothetical protein n=1 Tax=Streptomyces sp. TaxID=1931 RepID=UPI002D75F761
MEAPVAKLWKSNRLTVGAAVAVPAAAVRPDCADGGVGGGHLADQVGTGDGIGHARGGDQGREQ